MTDDTVQSMRTHLGLPARLADVDDIAYAPLCQRVLGQARKILGIQGNEGQGQ